MGIKKDSNFFMKFSAGSLAGAIGRFSIYPIYKSDSLIDYSFCKGSTVGNPFDVMKTQLMAAEGKEPPSLLNAAKTLFQKQGSILICFVRISFNEMRLILGISGFYRGIEANVMRAMVLNGTKMACYDQIKQIIIESKAIPAGTINTSVTIQPRHLLILSL